MKKLKSLVAVALMICALVLCAPMSGAIDLPGLEEHIELYETELEDDRLETYLLALQKRVVEVQKDTENTWCADANAGFVYDFDDDGFPELGLLYSSDGMTLNLMTVQHKGKDKMETEDRRLCELAEGATGALYLGTLSGCRVLHAVYANWIGSSTRVGMDTVMSFQDNERSVCHILKWKEDVQEKRGEYYVDGLRDDAAFAEIYAGIDKVLVKYGDEGNSLNQLLFDIVDFAL